MLQAQTGTAPQKSETGLAGLWPGVGTGRRTGEACRARCHSERESDHRVGNGASRGGRTVGGRDHGERACPTSCHSGGAGPHWARRVLWAVFLMRGGASLGSRAKRGRNLVGPLKKNYWCPGSGRRPATESNSFFRKSGSLPRIS